MTSEQRRKDFEEWAENNGYSTAKYNMVYYHETTTIAWEECQAAIQKEIDEYCPLSDPTHPHGIKFREETL